MAIDWSAPDIRHEFEYKVYDMSEYRVPDEYIHTSSGPDIYVPIDSRDEERLRYSYIGDVDSVVSCTVDEDRDSEFQLSASLGIDGGTLIPDSRKVIRIIHSARVGATTFRETLGTFVPVGRSFTYRLGRYTGTLELQSTLCLCKDMKVDDTYALWAAEDGFTGLLEAFNLATYINSFTSLGDYGDLRNDKSTFGAWISAQDFPCGEIPVSTDDAMLDVLHRLCEKYGGRLTLDRRFGMYMFDWDRPSSTTVKQRIDSASVYPGFSYKSSKDSGTSWTVKAVYRPINMGDRVVVTYKDTATGGTETIDGTVVARRLTLDEEMPMELTIDSLNGDV